jgi:hypothetical protein
MNLFCNSMEIMCYTCDMNNFLVEHF